MKHPSSLVSVWNLLITLRLTLGSHTSRLYGWFQSHFRSRTLQSGLIWASTTSFHKGTSRCFGQPMSLRNGFVNTAARRQFCSCSGRCHTMSSESFVFSSSVLDYSCVLRERSTSRGAWRSRYSMLGSRMYPESDKILPTNMYGKKQQSHQDT